MAMKKRYRLIGGTNSIYKAYFSGLNFREDPHNSYGPTYGTFTYLHVLDPEITIDVMLLAGWWYT